MAQGSCDIRNTTRGPAPRVPFVAMKEAILGKGYALSLVLCGDTLAQKLNRTYRNKEYRPNVLSFPLDRTEGEVFLNLRKAAREAKASGSPTNGRIALLFVHACFHLKGFDHGERMERAEARILSAFGY